MNTTATRPVTTPVVIELDDDGDPIEQPESCQHYVGMGEVCGDQAEHIDYDGRGACAVHADHS